jgi:hypothetical protein
MKFLVTHGTPKIKLQGLNCSISADSQGAIDAKSIVNSLIEQGHTVTVLTVDPNVFENTENLTKLKFESIDEFKHIFEYLCLNVKYDGIAHLAWFQPLKSLTFRTKFGFEENPTLVDELMWANKTHNLEMNLENDEYIMKMLSTLKVENCNILCRTGLTMSNMSKKTMSFTLNDEMFRSVLAKNVSMLICDIYANDGTSEAMALVTKHGALMFSGERLEIAIAEALLLK